MSVSVKCPECAAEPGKPCVYGSLPSLVPHVARAIKAAAALSPDEQRS